MENGFCTENFSLKTYHGKKLQNAIMIENENAIRRNAVAEVRQFFRCIRNSFWNWIEKKKQINSCKRIFFETASKSIYKFKKQLICCAVITI